MGDSNANPELVTAHYLTERILSQSTSVESSLIGKLERQVLHCCNRKRLTVYIYTQHTTAPTRARVTPALGCVAFRVDRPVVGGFGTIYSRLSRFKVPPLRFFSLRGGWRGEEKRRRVDVCDVASRRNSAARPSSHICAPRRVPPRRSVPPSKRAPLPRPLYPRRSQSGEPPTPSSTRGAARK